jgi:type IV secretory pathway TraG/TraD family ATPase VirD4
MNYANSNGGNRVVRPPMFRETDVLFLCLACGALLILLYIATTRWHFTMRQVQEIAAYCLLTLGFCYVGIWHLMTRLKRRQEKWTPVPIAPTRDRQNLAKAWNQDAVVLGHDAVGRPWLWPDDVRVMQGIVLGQTGSGKTTLLRNIITQDLARRVGPTGQRHKIPMVIFDGKGDLDFFHSLLPHIHRAGRLQDLRLLNPARPDISVLYNPFHTDDDNYMAQVNMVFGSFNLHDEFFAKHQLNYLADIVRVLTYTGLRYNFYDVIVMALDEKVLREQADKARARIDRDSTVSTQRRLNFEMSVKNLFQSLEDRERVPKIQGLLNECMTFLDDELSVITGPYEDVLSIDDVIEQELILFVTLNVNKNTEPVRALGKMLLQNLQLVVGKRYESEQQRRRIERPLFSVILDEFAPFGYRNFAQILQTSRGTKTAFLFSMQSLPQLMQVGRGFKEDVTSAPNTTIILRTRDEETARYFIRASAQETVSRRSYSLEQQRVFVHEWYEKTGAATEREDKEYRAKDLDVKTLPKGQMQILMTDDARGVLHSRLHVRAPEDIVVPCFEPRLYPRLRHSLADMQGANLRFKSPEIAAQIRQPRRVKFGGRP